MTIGFCNIIDVYCAKASEKINKYSSNNTNLYEEDNSLQSGGASMNVLFLNVTETLLQREPHHGFTLPDSTYPPLGILYMSGMLESHGHTVELLDFQHEKIGSFDQFFSEKEKRTWRDSNPRLPT